MPSASLIRVAARGSVMLRASAVRTATAQPLMIRSVIAARPFSVSATRRSGDHAEETFEEFTAR